MKKRLDKVARTETRTDRERSRGERERCITPAGNKIFEFRREPGAMSLKNGQKFSSGVQWQAHGSCEMNV